MKIILLSLFAFPLFLFGQPDTSKYYLYKNRTDLEKRLLKDVIDKKLSLELNEINSEEWEDAFFALLYLNRKNIWVSGRIDYGISLFHTLPVSFQRGILELVYGHYPGKYYTEIYRKLSGITDLKVYSMAVEYLLLTANEDDQKILFKSVRKKAKQEKNNPFLMQLQHSFKKEEINSPSLHPFLQRNYLAGNVIVITFQRSNRNYPGISIIRDRDGNFLKDSSGEIVNIPQLARSLSGLPGYLTNGNTPAGILRMDGYDVSRAGAIGPTENIQLTLAGEYNAHHFFRDSSLTDTIARIKQYRNLLPEGFKDYFPVYESYYAGIVGRTEIIAHGTTVKPEYYKNAPYFPFTPTLGCLCTYESWDDSDGSRLESGQQKLVDSIARAGGPDGYWIVLDIDNLEKPVTLQTVMPLLHLAGSQ